MRVRPWKQIRASHWSQSYERALLTIGDLSFYLLLFKALTSSARQPTRARWVLSADVTLFAVRQLVAEHLAPAALPVYLLCLRLTAARFTALCACAFTCDYLHLYCIAGVL